MGIFSKKKKEKIIAGDYVLPTLKHLKKDFGKKPRKVVKTEETKNLDYVDYFVYVNINGKLKGYYNNAVKKVKKDE